MADLPQMYEILLNFFWAMGTSLMLLSKPKRTFQNISRQVEILTGRKFLFKHFAQIKYILPEAVEIKRVLIHDDETMLMKTDMGIALLHDDVKDHDEVSTYVVLNKLFSSRLRQFYTTHPEGCDVPEAELP